MYRNALEVVEAVNRDFPGLIGDGTRFGVFVDQVAHRLNRQDGEVRWGRKARQAGGGNPNGDGLTYLNDPNDRSNKIIVDIIAVSPDPGAINPDSRPSWQEYLGGNPGNGFWTEPISPFMGEGQPADPGPTPGPGPTPDPSSPDLDDRLLTIERTLAELDARVESHRERMEAINTAAVLAASQAVQKPLPRYVARIRILGYSITVVSTPEGQP